jgi:hypothetical protein
MHIINPRDISFNIIWNISEDKGRQFGLKIMQKKRNRETNNRILYTV